MTRSCGGVAGDRLVAQSLASACSNSRPSAETSRWILEGK